MIDTLDPTSLIVKMSFLSFPVDDNNILNIYIFHLSQTAILDWWLHTFQVLPPLVLGCASCSASGVSKVISVNSVLLSWVLDFLLTLLLFAITNPARSAALKFQWQYVKTFNCVKVWIYVRRYNILRPLQVGKPVLWHLWWRFSPVAKIDQRI